MKRTIALMVSVLSVMSTFAQDLPMIQSKDTLRTYALEQSADVAASINASLPVGNDSYDFVPVSEPTAEGISNTIAGMNLSVDVANHNDPLFIWAGAYNVDGDPLFTGWKQFWLVNGKGGYALPDGYGDVTMELFDNIPIRVGGAQSAIINIKDSNGQTIMGASVRVENGKVYFPRQLAGTNAILSVYVTGSKEVGPGWLYWDVSNGSKITPEHFGVTLKTTIRGVVSAKDTASNHTNTVTLVVPTTNNIGENLTIEYKSNGRGLLRLFSWTSEGKWFKGAWVRKAGTEQWIPYTATVTAPPTAVFIEVPVQSGIYYVVPSWDPQDLTEPADPWYPPYDGGSNGGGKG